MWQNSKTQKETKLKKTKNVTKLKKIKMWQNSNVTKLKNSKCDLTQKLKYDQTKKSICDKTLKFQIWQYFNTQSKAKLKTKNVTKPLKKNSRTQIASKLISLNCDKTHKTDLWKSFKFKL